MNAYHSQILTILSAFSPILTTHTQSENREKVRKSLSLGVLRGQDSSQHITRFSFVMWSKVRIVRKSLSLGVRTVHASNLILNRCENQYRGENHG